MIICINKSLTLSVIFWKAILQKHLCKDLAKDTQM